MSSNEENKGSDTPANNPSNAMDSRKDVENSPDEKINQDFPGYPHYPASEDIMSQTSGSHRVDADIESMGAGPNASGVNQRFVAGQDSDRSQTNSLHNDAAASGGEQDGTNEEIGLPQNVSNEEMDRDQPGTDIDEAAAKGSLNP